MKNKKNDKQPVQRPFSESRTSGRAAGLPSDIRPEDSDRLTRYLRRSAAAAAAGVGAFGVPAASDAQSITSFDAPEFLQRSLVGNPYENNQFITALNTPYPEAYPNPFRSVGWATEGFTYQYDGAGFANLAYGIDLDFNGSGDINFFRGQYSYGYLAVNANQVGFSTEPVFGSGQVTLLSNDNGNPDPDGDTQFIPNNSQLLQAFNAGETIGDGNDVGLTTPGVEGALRVTGYPGDVEGVPYNPENLFAVDENGDETTESAMAESAFIGFEITGLSTGTGSGFGWVEVIVRDPVEGGDFPHPELQIIRWAFTNDGSAIVAGDTGAPDELPGDYNGDGTVDAADYTVWRDNLGAETPLPGENPGAATPGVVDIEDYNFWVSQFGATTGSATAAPEPTTLGLFAAGAGGLATRRRKRR